MKVKLGDICKIYSGGDKPKVVSPQKTEECKIPIYGNAIDEEGLYGYTNFSVIDEKAVTISARGSNCGASFFRNEPYVPIVRLLSLIPCDEIIVPEYLYYIIKNRPFKSTGSGQPQITIPQVADCEVEIEENIDIQKRIAKVLFDIDLKIKNNNAISAELETMARTIYDYWFLQFDFPDENGRPYKSSGGKMIWNEELKCEIPDGWKSIKLGQVFDFIKGKIPNEFYEKKENNLVDYLTIEAVNIGATQYCRPNSMILTNGEVLMVMDGAASCEVYVGNKGAIGSTFCKLQIKNDIINNNLLYLIMKKHEKNFKKINTGSTVPHANKNYINNFYICIPTNQSNKEKMQNVLDEIMSKIIHVKKENQELTSLRDFLLPLLMNGQVGFKEC